MDEKVEVKTEKKTGKIKRNVTILVVVFCVCAAVYLNYTHNNPRNADSVLSNNLTEEKNNEETAVSTDDYVSEYFAQARLVRQEARDKSLAILEAMTVSEAATPENLTAVMNQIAAMTTFTMQETQIENIILAKGFEDCVVSMGADKITIAVPAAETGLTADEVARITEAIITETGYNATQITVIPVKKPEAEIPSPEPAQIPSEGGTEAETGSIDDLASQGGYIEDGVTIYE